jgi:hypothetical protein
LVIRIARLQRRVPVARGNILHCVFLLVIIIVRVACFIVVGEVIPIAVCADAKGVAQTVA